MVISILIGALYDEWTVNIGGMPYSLLAHLLGVSGEVCGGIGGFLVSYAVGREILGAFAAEKMAMLQQKMAEFDGSLFRCVAARACTRGGARRGAAAGHPAAQRDVRPRAPLSTCDARPRRGRLPRRAGRYMLFLRVSPMLPNWFVNYGTPLVGMPLGYFALASLIAIQPAAAMSISMGGMVRQAGEAGLDLLTLTKRGAAMALTTFVLSLPLVPADDWRAATARLRRLLGLSTPTLEAIARG